MFHPLIVPACQVLQVLHVQPFDEQAAEGLDAHPEYPRHIPDRVIVTGHPEKRLPNHASFCVEYIEGEGMLLFLDQKGIRAASGSACTSKALKGSYVLEAIGVPTALAQGSIVFTMGPRNRPEDVDAILSVMKPVVARLREMSPIYKRK